jgi:hypothetical protein
VPRFLAISTKGQTTLQRHINSKNFKTMIKTFVEFVNSCAKALTASVFERMGLGPRTIKGRKPNWRLQWVWHSRGGGATVLELFPAIVENVLVCSRVGKILL